MSTSTVAPPPAWKAFLQLFVAYLLGAWTFLQFLEWILARMDISPNWVDLVLWINLGLLPSLLLYFWNHQRMNDFRFNRWEKIFIAINVMLMVIVVALSFRGKDLGSTTKQISYVGEDGREEIRKITKSEFRTPINVYNFESTGRGTPDSTQWLADGIRELLTLDLKQEKALTVAEVTGEVTAATKLKSSKLAEYYVDGSYQFSEAGYTVTPRVHQARNGKVLSEQTFRGHDLYSLIDSASVFVRTATGISPDEQLFSPDLPLREYTSDSLRAVRYFCQSNYAGWESALEVDPNFTLVHAYLGRSHLATGSNTYERDQHLNQALEGRHKLPSDLSQEVLTNWHLANGDLEAAEASLELQLQVEPANEAFNQQMIKVLSLGQRLKDLLAFTEAHVSRYYSPFAAQKFGDALLVNHRFDELLEKIRPISLVLPKDAAVLDYTFKAQLFDRRWAAASETLKKMKAVFPENRSQLAFYDRALKNHRAANGIPPGWEKMIGKQQILGSERVNTFTRNPNDGITFTNHNGQVLLPTILSKDSFLLGPFYYLDIARLHFSSGQLSLVEMRTLRKPNVSIDDVSSFYSFTWPDALAAAEAALKRGQYQRAKDLYLELQTDYPTHFFIQSALDHIEYVTSIGPEAYQAQIMALEGSSANKTDKTDFWVDEGTLYIKARGNDKHYYTTLDLRPISPDTYVSLVSKRVRYTLTQKDGNPRVKRYERYSVEDQLWTK